MATKHFCDACGDEVKYGQMHRFGLGTSVKEIFDRELCGACNEKILAAAWWKFNEILAAVANPHIVKDDLRNGLTADGHGVHTII